MPYDPNFVYVCSICGECYYTQAQQQRCELDCLIDKFNQFSKFSPEKQDEEIVIEVSL